MSTRDSLWWSEDAHLYFDYADESGGPHAYLRINHGLVKSVKIEVAADGLSLTVRLPAEVFPILRPDIQEAANKDGQLGSNDQLREFVRGVRAQRRLGGRPPASGKLRGRRTRRKS